MPGGANRSSGSGTLGNMPSLWARRAGWPMTSSSRACQADGIAILRRSSGGGTVVARAWRPLRHGAPARRRRARALTRGPGARSRSRADRGRHPRAPAFPSASSAEATWSSTTESSAAAPSAGSRPGSWCTARSSLISRSSASSRYLKMPRRQPEYRAGRSHEDFLVNLPLNRHELADAIRNTFSSGASSISRRLRSRRRSFNLCCPRNS